MTRQSLCRIDESLHSCRSQSGSGRPPLNQTWQTLGLSVAVLVLAGCSSANRDDKASPAAVLRLAVTTSTRDSGLLDVLLPAFEQRHRVRADVIAVGTGAALKLGQAGDVDVVLVHAREAEDAFMRASHGIRREEVMYNMFQILGPAHDPAGVRDMEPAAALKRIATSGQPFVSRGDKSGTHQREEKLWDHVGGRPQWNSLVESGQGMGPTLAMADQMSAYVLTDSATYLKFKRKIQLIPLVTSSKSLRNPYGIMAVHPSKHSSINAELAEQFVEFIISAEAQRLILNYKLEGEQLFYPLQLQNPI